MNVGTIDGGLSPQRRRPAEPGPGGRAGAPTKDNARRVEEAILGLKPVTPGVTLRVEGGIGRPPMERTPRNQRLWEAARRLAKELGLDLEEGMAGGGSDGNTTSLFTATLDGLGQSATALTLATSSSTCTGWSSGAPCWRCS